MKMDLKRKGISWVGNMFQKFEAVCQEVDNIINQDKVKYVENQVSSAGANVKRLYSDVVQGLLPPIDDPMKCEAKAPTQRRRVPINGRYRSLSYNEGKAASNVVNISSVGSGTSTIDQIDNQSQGSCKVPFVNEEVAQVPNHSSLKLNAVLPLEKNDDVLLDKYLYENLKENAGNELLTEKNDGTLTNILTLVDSDASNTLSHSMSNVSTDGFDLQLEDDVLLVGRSDGVLTDKDESKSFEDDATMKFNASDSPFVNEEVAQVPNHSSLKSNADLTFKKNDDVLLDKNLFEKMKENTDSELLSEKNDGILTNKLTLVESDASNTLSRSMINVSTEINDNERASSVCDGFDLQLEDDVLLGGNNDGVLTDKYESKNSEENTSMKFNASDPLKHLNNHISCEGKVTNDEAILMLDNSYLPMVSSRFSWKNDGDLSSENSAEFTKNAVTMEPKAVDHLNDSHLNRVCSETNFMSKEADGSNLHLKCVVLSGRIDDAMMDKDLNKSPVKEASFEDDPYSYLLNLPRHAKGISFTNTEEEAIMDSDRNHLQLATGILARKNDDSLTVKYSNESLENDSILELKNDAKYPLKNQPRCTSSSTKYKNEEFSSVSNDSFLKLESEVIFGENSKALMEKSSDASCKEQANLELSTQLTLDCGEESIKEALCSYGNECEGDIVTSNGNPQEISTHCPDEVTMETTSKYLEHGVGFSSNAVDATSDELASVVLTSGETAEETETVSSLKPVEKGSFSAFRSSVSTLSNSTVIHEKPVEQNAYIEWGSHPSFEVFTSPSYGSKASNTKFVSPRSSLSSMDSSAGTRTSRANDTTFLPKFFTSSQGVFSKTTSSRSPSLSSEGGCPHDSSDYILDAEMETVDLGHKVIHEDECDVLDYKSLHAISRRTQKLRSYKKRIQDAFTSKKRLAKEYEQLAIWYGDTDMEFSTNTSQKLEKENASTSYVSDFEWELL